MTKGQQYVITRDGFSLPVGTRFTYLGDVQHLDWFKCRIRVEGREMTVGYGLPDFCQEA